MSVDVIHPTIGQIVHFYEEEDLECILGAKRAAVVTDLLSEPEDRGGGAPYVSLAVLRPDGIGFPKRIAWSEEPRSNCWSWPKINLKANV